MFRRFSLALIFYLVGMLHGGIYHAWMVGDVITPDAMFYTMMTLPIFLVAMLIRMWVGVYGGAES